MAQTKKKATKKTLSVRSSKARIAIIVFVGIFGALAVGGIFARERTDYRLGQPIEDTVVRIENEKPQVITRDKSGMVRHESRGKSINVTTRGTVYCTPENEGEVKVVEITESEMRTLVRDIERQRPVKGSKLESEVTTSIGNSKKLQYENSTSTTSIESNIQRPAEGIQKAEKILDKVCQKPGMTIPETQVPVFNPSGVDAGSLPEGKPTGLQLVPKAYAGGEAPGEPLLSTAVEDDQIARINYSRSVSGIPILGKSNCLTVAARKWTRHMALVNHLYHSPLQNTVESECGTGWWRKIGENVGRGGESVSLFNAYMNSPGHRANILDRSFQRVGVGAYYYKHPANQTTVLWTTQLFAACQGSCANK